jgi:hypothetical protein
MAIAWPLCKMEVEDKKAGEQPKIVERPVTFAARPAKRVR